CLSAHARFHSCSSSLLRLLALPGGGPGSCLGWFLSCTSARPALLFRCHAPSFDRRATTRSRWSCHLSLVWRRRRRSEQRRIAAGFGNGFGQRSRRRGRVVGRNFRGCVWRGSSICLGRWLCRSRFRGGLWNRGR